MDIYVRIYAVCATISETAASGYSPPRSDEARQKCFLKISDILIALR